MSDARTVNLSLVSHTNAGKTTLVRTLLGQDVGEVRDAAHVTEVATGYVLLQAGDDTLMLWDTPGFGDTGRLVARLRQSGNPIGWLLSQVWDRWRDRPLWSSQQAVRNVREEADVILYLVNAAEDPAAATYVPLEMDVLDWVGKPVLLLLNQVGAPSDRGRREEERWRLAVGERPLVRGVVTLDAFARCWVQEGELLNRVAPLLEPGKQAALATLAGAWAARGLQRFHAAMRLLAGQLAAAVVDREEIGDRKLADRLRGAIMHPVAGDSSPQGQRAMGRLAERLDVLIRRSTDELIALHGLSGRAAGKVLERMRADYRETGSAREGVATVLGGLVSGAAGGLAADLAVGGLTLGGGMIIGSVLGAVGAKTAARGYNVTVAGGTDTNAVRWSDEFLAGLIRAALLRYLAVAHFGRGRGEWEEGEHPAHWGEAVDRAVEAERGALRSALGQRKDGEEAVGTALEPVLARAARRVLLGLYPEAAAIFRNEERLAAAGTGLVSGEGGGQPLN